MPRNHWGGWHDTHSFWRKELSSLWTLGDHILMHMWQWDTVLCLGSSESKRRAGEFGEQSQRREESREGETPINHGFFFNGGLSSSKFRRPFPTGYFLAVFSNGLLKKTCHNYLPWNTTVIFCNVKEMKKKKKNNLLAYRQLYMKHLTVSRMHVIPNESQFLQPWSLSWALYLHIHHDFKSTFLSRIAFLLDVTMSVPFILETSKSSLIPLCSSSSRQILPIFLIPRSHGDKGTA